MSIFTQEFLASLDASIVNVADAVTFPAECYTDSDFLNFEQRKIFNSEWLCVGLVSRIPRPGDYFSTTANSESIIVARDKSDEIHAFSSVCQHRGMQIIEDSGNCGTFTCPYHQWIYGLDGRLLGAPAMERTTDFKKGTGVSPNSKLNSGKALFLSTLIKMHQRWPQPCPDTNPSLNTTNLKLRCVRELSRSLTCHGTGR